jgi:hypothetical protein
MSSALKLSSTDDVLLQYMVKNPHTSAASLNAAIGGRGVDYTPQLTALHRNGWLVRNGFRYCASPRACAYVAEQMAKLAVARAAEKRAELTRTVREILGKRRLWRQEHRQVEKADVIDIFQLRKKLGEVRVADVASILRELSKEKEPLVYQYDVEIHSNSDHLVEHAVWATVDIPSTPTPEEAQRAELAKTTREVLTQRRRFRRAYAELEPQPDIINIFQLANTHLGGVHVRVAASVLEELSKEKDPLVYCRYRDNKGYAVWATVESCDAHSDPNEECGSCQEEHLFVRTSVPVGLEGEVQDTAVSRSGMEV